VIESNSENERFVWLKRAFIIQAALLVLCLSTIAFVSFRFSMRQREMAQQLEKQAKDLQDATSNLVTALLNRALDAERSGNTGTAESLYGDALRVAPSDPFIWRRYALLLIHQNQAQRALNYFQKAPIDSTDGRNLLTQSILYCALNQFPKAEDLKKQALLSYSPTPQDNTDFQNICHRPL